MAHERIFTANGLLPKKGMSPILGLLLFVYAIFILVVMFSRDMGTVRVTGPGIIPILLIARARNNKERPISLFLDHIEKDELCLGYYEEGESGTKEYVVDEYSYFYSPNKKDQNRVDLFFKIKSARQDILFLSEENVILPNSGKWEMSEGMAGDGAIKIKTHDLEGLAVQMNRYSS